MAVSGGARRLGEAPDEGGPGLVVTGDLATASEQGEGDDQLRSVGGQTPGHPVPEGMADQMDGPGEGPEPDGHVGGDGMEIGPDRPIDGLPHTGQVHGHHLPARLLECRRQLVEVGAGPAQRREEHHRSHRPVDVPRDRVAGSRAIYCMAAIGCFGGYRP